MASGAYNRKKGHNYECQIVREMRHFYPEAVTARNGARGEDPRGVDLVNTGMFNVQCKARQSLNVFDTLKAMPEDQGINTVFWMRNRCPEVVCMVILQP